MRELLAQRQIGQRIKRVVEIEQQLAPLDASDVVGGAHFQPGRRELRRGARVVLLEDDVA